MTHIPLPDKDTGGAWFEIGGLRGRPFSAWLRRIGLATCTAFVGIVFGLNATGVVVVAVLFLVGMTLLILPWSRGRIALYGDRMRIERWEFPDQHEIIPYSEIRHVSLRGTQFSVVHTSGWREILLHPVAAEDLLDHLVEHMEQRGYHFTVDERGLVRSSWAWTLSELFPWQQMTTEASLQVEPSGALEFTTDRTEPLRGSCFKAWEIHAPGDDPAASEPVLRLEDDRITLVSGMMIGKVVLRPGDVVQLVFTSGSVVEMQDGRVSVDDEVVGRVLRGEKRFALELDRAVPEVIALLVLSVHAWVGRDGHSLYSQACIRDLARDLAVVGSQPRAEPLLLIEAERNEQTIYRLFKFWHWLFHRLARFFTRESRHAGWGSIAFYPDSIHIERSPVPALGENDIMRFDLAYDDVTRLEFAAPDTLILAFGLVTHGHNQQIAMVLGPMEAQDKFDSMVELIEDRGDGNLFSVLDDGQLTHSREWTWEDRFEDMGLANSVTIGVTAHAPARRWWLETGDKDVFEIIEDHGLVLVSLELSDGVLMQGLHSQILDGAGMALSHVTRDGSEVGFLTSHDERLTLTDGGEIRLDDTVIGKFPPGGFGSWDGGSDPMKQYGQVFGTSPVVPAPSKDVTFEVDHPIPKPWLLALAMISLLPRHDPPER